MALGPLRKTELPDPQRVVSWATMLAGVSLVLVVVNIVLASLNQSLQAEANQRQQQLAQAAQLNAVTNVLQAGLVQQAQQGDAKIQAILKKAAVPFTAPAAAGGKP